MQKLDAETKAPVCPDLAKDMGADSTVEERSKAIEAARNAIVDLTMTRMSVWMAALEVCRRDDRESMRVL